MAIGGLLRAAMMARNWGTVARQSREITQGRRLLPVVNEFPLRDAHLARTKQRLELNDAFRNLSDERRGMPWEDSATTIGRINERARLNWWENNKYRYVDEEIDPLGWHTSVKQRPFLLDRWLSLRQTREMERSLYGRPRGELWAHSRNRRTGQYNDPERVRIAEQRAYDKGDALMGRDLDIAEGYHDAYQHYLRYGDKGPSGEIIPFNEFKDMIDRAWMQQRQQQLWMDSPMARQMPVIDPFDQVDDAFGNALLAWEKSGRKMPGSEVRQIMDWERQMGNVSAPQRMFARPGRANWLFPEPMPPYFDIGRPFN